MGRKCLINRAATAPRLVVVRRLGPQEIGSFENRRDKIGHYTFHLEIIMSDRYLVAYATKYGSTEEVAQAIAKTLGEFVHSVDCKPLREVKKLHDFDAAVIGAPLYIYRWHKDAVRFLSRHRKSLMRLPTAVFALGPVRDPHNEQEWRDSRHQLDQELSRFAWFKPVVIQLFGGKYDPKSLGFPLKQLAGDTPTTDIRDWVAIEAWTRELPEKFALHASKPDNPNR